MSVEVVGDASVGGWEVVASALGAGSGLASLVSRQGCCHPPSSVAYPLQCNSPVLSVLRLRYVGWEQYLLFCFSEVTLLDPLEAESASNGAASPLAWKLAPLALHFGAPRVVGVGFGVEFLAWALGCNARLGWMQVPVFGAE